MDIGVYKRLNSINGFNALEFPDIIDDPLFYTKVLECSVRFNRVDILNKLNINHDDINVEWYYDCKDILTLTTIFGYVSITDDIVKDLILADNITAIRILNIDLDRYMDFIEIYIPINIIKYIMNSDKLKVDEAFVQSLLIDKYDVCHLLINKVNKSKISWSSILNSNDDRIVNLCMSYFTIPEYVSDELMCLAIRNGHYEFFKLKYDGITEYSPELLTNLISNDKFDKAMLFQELNIFTKTISTKYLYINNIFGYTFYHDMSGFNAENIIGDMITEGRHEMIKLIIQDFCIEPSIEYLILGLNGKCPETLLVVLNHLVTKDQIISSLSISLNIRVPDRMCYLVYIRVCYSLGVLPHNIHEYAIVFDSVSILKYSNYDNALTIYDAVMNGTKRIFNYCYRPEIFIPSAILVSGYEIIAKRDDLRFLYLLIKEYGVPKSYDNKHGGIGTIKMIDLLK